MAGLRGKTVRVSGERRDRIIVDDTPLECGCVRTHEAIILSYDGGDWRRIDKLPDSVSGVPCPHAAAPDPEAQP